MNIIDGISLLIGRIIVGVIFFGIGIYLLGTICSFFKNPRCPKCDSKKEGLFFGKLSAGEHRCANCGQHYWHKGWRNYVENPDKK